jgi:putative ABC transport system substrate-binding protein
MKMILALCAIVFTVELHAQAPAKVPRVGVLVNGTVATNGHLTEAFIQGMSDLGYTGGKNIVFDVRYADGQLDRLPALAKDLADTKVDVFFAASSLASSAAKKLGTTTPIVFSLAPDPINDGFVQSLAHPGGSMTGLTSLSPELAAKRVEILLQTFPKFSRLAVLYALPFPGVALELSETERAAKALAKELLRAEAKRPEEFEAAFAEITKWRADALLVIENPMFFANRNAIVSLAAKNRLPAIYRAREYVVSGGLMSYGPDYADLIRRAAGHVDKILKGAKPGDLPVEQPVKFELVINQKTAKALGATIPKDLLVRADQVLD